jgi:hypothetical protein
MSSKLLKQYKRSLSKANKKYTLGTLATQNSKVFKSKNEDLFAPQNTNTVEEYHDIHQAVSNLYYLFSVYEKHKHKKSNSEE